MSDSDDSVVKLFATMGIDAQIRLDDEKKQVIAVATEQYLSHRSWIDSWFTLVGQKRQVSFFRERLRGTGQTSHGDR